MSLLTVPPADYALHFVDSSMTVYVYLDNKMYTVSFHLLIAYKHSQSFGRSTWIQYIQSNNPPLTKNT